MAPVILYGEWQTNILRKKYCSIAQFHTYQCSRLLGVYLTCNDRGVARIWEGPRIFFSGLEFYYSESMRFARGVRGYAPPLEIFLNGAI